MNKNGVNKVGLDLIYLSRCALHSTVPDRERLCDMDLSLVYKMSKHHSVNAIAYIALEAAEKSYGESFCPTDVMEKWRASYHYSIRRLLGFDIEREKLCAFLREEGIWYLPLKGILLQNYYPTLGMRQMSDNDILVDSKKAKIIRKYMTENGYEVISYGNHCHDTYRKDGIIFEIHRKLAEDSDKTKKAYHYYKNVKNRRVGTKNSTEMRFTDEDFYVYYIFHAYKHFAVCGCGLRTLTDIYLYLNKNKDNLDFEYIKEQLSVLGIEKYESSTREIAISLFSENTDVFDKDLLSEEKIEILSYYLLSGTFGTQSNRIENTILDMADGEKITGKTKARYLYRRIFPKFEYYKNSYPRASRFIITIPLLWLIRIFRGISKRKIAIEEFDKVKRIK